MQAISATDTRLNLTTLLSQSPAGTSHHPPQSAGYGRHALHHRIPAARQASRKHRPQARGAARRLRLRPSLKHEGRSVMLRPSAFVPHRESGSRRIAAARCRLPAPQMPSPPCAASNLPSRASLDSVAATIDSAFTSKCRRRCSRLSLRPKPSVPSDTSRVQQPRRKLVRHRPSCSRWPR